MMFRYLGTFAVLAVCLFALAMVGCGPDDPPVEEDPIKFVSADPVEGSTIQNDATITVTFDGIPEGLKVTGGSAVPGGKTVSIAGPFAAGPLVLGLQWEGDGVVLSYTVEEPPAAIIDVDPPEGSTIGQYEDIWITFDSPPAKVWVIPVSAEVDVEDNIVNIYGDFDPGPLELKIGWDDEERTLRYSVSPPPPPAAIVAVDPPDGSVIAHNQTITVTFDNPLAGGAAVSVGTSITTGKEVHISGPFNPGPLALEIFWDDGWHLLNYTVIAPDVTAPTVTGGTVWDGDKDWDPEVLNADAVIFIEFSEDVTGNIALQTEAGDDVGWIGKFQDNVGLLLFVQGKGREIAHETTYVIVGRVSDPTGNTLDFSIAFTTKGD